MINKIKDFLKNKLRRKASQDLSGQDEVSDNATVENPVVNQDQTNPGYKLETQRDHVDVTGDIYLPLEDLQSGEKIPVSGKLTLKEKLASSLSQIKQKI